jgi:hypothetical protein
LPLSGLKQGRSLKIIGQNGRMHHGVQRIACQLREIPAIESGEKALIGISGGNLSRPGDGLPQFAHAVAGAKSTAGSNGRWAECGVHEMMKRFSAGDFARRSH